MPTYEYFCSKCNKQFELFQSMLDDVLTACPKNLCQKKPWGKGKVKRVIGAGAGLIFKGSGFYITDYRSEGYKEAAKKDSASATPDKKSDAKEKSEPKPPVKKPDSAKSSSAKPSPGKSKK